MMMKVITLFTCQRSWIKEKVNAQTTFRNSFLEAILFSLHKDNIRYVFSFRFLRYLDYNRKYISQGTNLTVEAKLMEIVR